MNDIQQTRWESILRRLAAIPSAVVSPTVAGEIVPVLQVEPPGPEHWYESEWRTYQSSAAPGPVVGEYARVDLWNDSKNVLIVVDEVWITATANLMFGFTASTVAIAGQIYASLASPGDTRQGTALACAGRVGRNTAVAVLGAHLCGIVPANNSFVARAPFVIGPGGSVMVACATDNVQMTVSFRWRERAIGPLEL